MTAVRYWFGKFKRCLISAFEKLHPGRPTESVSDPQNSSIVLSLGEYGIAPVLPSLLTVIHMWRSLFAAVAEGYEKGESKQSAESMNEDETKHSLREDEKRQSDLTLLR
ncbi:hypothetical protein NPIL_153521 [Nephila pilipes]|uniref:Uncharacterized protein n=1 Tax=Nephila pilipes TaxID=299642 RepID=A0A8X6PM82_NEPPI|nr:hypothetical protein NPIL_153521 [Nephila pilipes]